MILFDIDGTLIDRNDEPRQDVITLFHAFYDLNIPVGIISGGGQDYAERWAERLGMTHYCSFIGSKSNLVKAIEQGAVLLVDDKAEDPLGPMRVVNV